MGVTYSTNGAATYVPLATYTATGNVSSYTFSNISQAYSHLVVVIKAKSTQDNYPQLRFNNDSGSNYWGANMGTNWSTFNSYAHPNASDNLSLAYYANMNSDNVNYMNIHTIYRYADSNKTKWVTAIGGSNQGRDNVWGYWTGTASITSITYIANTGSYDAGTNITIYGLLGA